MQTLQKYPYDKNKLQRNAPCAGYQQGVLTKTDLYDVKGNSNKSTHWDNKFSASKQRCPFTRWSHFMWIENKFLLQVSWTVEDLNSTTSQELKKITLNSKNKINSL